MGGRDKSVVGELVALVPDRDELGDQIVAGVAALLGDLALEVGLHVLLDLAAPPVRLGLELAAAPRPVLQTEVVLGGDSEQAADDPHRQRGREVRDDALSRSS
jgi:hypothetical protein